MQPKKAKEIFSLIGVQAVALRSDPATGMKYAFT